MELRPTQGNCNAKAKRTIKQKPQRKKRMAAKGSEMSRSGTKACRYIAFQHWRMLKRWFVVATNGESSHGRKHMLLRAARAY